MAVGEGAVGVSERGERAKSLACCLSVPRGQRNPAPSSGHLPVTGVREARSAPGGVCVALKAPSPRGAALSCQRRARRAPELGVWKGAAPSGRPAGVGAGGGRAPGTRAALWEQARARGARGARRGGPGRGRGGRPGPRRLRGPSGSGPAPGPASGAGGGGRRRTRCACLLGRVHPPRPPSPRPAFCSHPVAPSPPPRCAPARAALSNQPGRIPRLRSRPGPAGTGPAADATSRGLSPAADERRRRSRWPPAERRAGLLRPSRPLGAPRVRKRGHPGSGLSASGAPRGARSYCAGLKRAKLGPCRTRGCRARAEGSRRPPIPATLAHAPGRPTPGSPVA